MTDGPISIDLEQSLLGAIFCNPEVLNTVSEFLSPDHFGEPLHGRIYDACQSLQRIGKAVTVSSVKTHMNGDPGLAEVGANKYLGRLVTASVTTIHAEDYGRTLYDLAKRREIITAAEEIQFAAMNPTVGTKADELLMEFESRLAKVRGASITDKTVWTVGESFENALKAHDRIQSGEASKNLVPYGISGLDDLLGGVPRGEYGVVGARPGMGKSTLACCVAVTAALSGYSVGFVCPDMGERQVSSRLACALLAIKGIAKIHYEKILKGRLSRLERDQLEEARSMVAGLPIEIDDKANPTVANIAARARDWERRWKKNDRGLDLLLVDHIHNLKPSQALRGKGRTEQVGEISNDLKAVARDLDVGLLAFAQLSRPEKGVDVKRPSLADLRWAGEIEQDVRWAIFLHRPWEYEKNKEPHRAAFKTDMAYHDALADWQAERAVKENLMEIIVEKQNNGATGVVTARCDLPVNLITDGGN